MADENVEVVMDVETHTAPKPGPRPSQRSTPVNSRPVREMPDPDRYLWTAKRVVVENYNEHRDESKSPELTMDMVYIVWFSKTLANWKAIVASPVARGLLWEVTYNGHRREAYIDIYKKLNNVKVPLEES